MIKTYSILTFNFSEDDLLLESLQNYYTKDAAISFFPIDKIENLGKLISQHSQNTILVNIKNKKEMLSFVKFLIEQKRKKQYISAIVFTKGISEKLEKLLMVNNCHDLLRPDINHRTVIFKINSQRKRVTQKRLNEESKTLFSHHIRTKDNTQREDNVQKIKKIHSQSDSTKATVPEKIATRELKPREDFSIIEVGDGTKVSTESGHLFITLIKDGSLVIETQLSDFYLEGLSVYLEAEDLSLNEEVKVKIDLLYNNSHEVLEFNADVEFFEQSENEYLYHFRIKNLSENEYNKFIDLYESRQENINSFLLLAKGA